MDKKESDRLKLHIAGATVLHTSPFAELESFKNENELSQDFINKWIIPFYTKIDHTGNEWISILKAVKSEITDEVIQKSLGDFNWRTRQTGAFFSAITNQPQYIDVIGIHLLKSEVCYAGEVYCKVLASFNTSKCIDYLNLYLDYYLTKPDLWFDQRQAMEAVLYLDKINNTNHFHRHIDRWHAFIENKPEWDKEITCDDLEEQLIVIEDLKQC